MALLEEMHLPREMDRPLIGIVSRFADQKGMDLLAEIARPLAEQMTSALVVLGSGEQRIEDMFRYFACARPDKFGVRIGYDDGAGASDRSGRGHVPDAQPV